MTLDQSKLQREEWTLKVLEATEDYLRLQAVLAQKLQEGHLDIARAKYSLPPGTVDYRHFGPESTATLHVCVSDLKDQGSHSPVSFSIMDDLSTAEGKVENGPSNPLRKLGGMTPLALRHAQQCFKEATSTAAELAVVSERLQSLLEREPQDKNDASVAVSSQTAVQEVESLSQASS